MNDITKEEVTEEEGEWKMGRGGRGGLERSHQYIRTRLRWAVEGYQRK